MVAAGPSGNVADDHCGILFDEERIIQEKIIRFGDVPIDLKRCTVETFRFALKTLIGRKQTFITDERKGIALLEVLLDRGILDCSAFMENVDRNASHRFDRFLGDRVEGGDPADLVPIGVDSIGSRPFKGEDVQHFTPDGKLSHRRGEGHLQVGAFGQLAGDQHRVEHSSPFQFELRPLQRRGGDQGRYERPEGRDDHSMLQGKNFTEPIRLFILDVVDLLFRIQGASRRRQIVNLHILRGPLDQVPAFGIQRQTQIQQQGTGDFFSGGNDPEPLIANLGDLFQKDRQRISFQPLDMQAGFGAPVCLVG